jgi:serine phosphatase RsbU (regulator of sigma subunit)
MSARSHCSSVRRSDGAHMTVHEVNVRPSGDAASCGDFAEHLNLSPDRSALLVGDIAGRGLAVGHAARGLHAYVRSSLVSGMPPSECLRACDDFFTRSIMCDEVPFATVFIAETDESESMLRYASAGHEPGLLFSVTGRHRHLDPTGPILGLRALLPEFGFGERVVPVSCELLVIVTDGVTEARRFDGEELSFFGSTGVVRAVRDARFDRHETATAIHQAALRHARGALNDDASVVVSGISGARHTHAATMTGHRYDSAASLLRHAVAAVQA